MNLNNLNASILLTLEASSRKPAAELLQYEKI